MRQSIPAAGSSDIDHGRGQDVRPDADAAGARAGAAPGVDPALADASALAHYLRVLEGDAFPYPRALGQVRRNRGLSVAALARTSGIARGTISALESGRHGARARTIARLANALGVAATDLIGDGAPTGAGGSSRRVAARAAGEASSRANGADFYRRMGQPGGELVKAAYGRALYVDIGRANGTALLRRRGAAYFRGLRTDQLATYPCLPGLGRARVARGLTQRALARLAGLSHSTVRAIEDGGSTRPATAIRLAEALGLRPDALREAHGARSALDGAATTEHDEAGMARRLVRLTERR